MRICNQLFVFNFLSKPNLEFRILKIGPQGAKLDILMFFKCALLGDQWGLQSPHRRLHATCGHIQAVCVLLSTFICRELDIA